MFRIIRTRVLRHLDAQVIELHDRAEHYRARAEKAEAALRDQHTTTTVPQYR